MSEKIQLKIDILSTKCVFQVGKFGAWVNFISFVINKNIDGDISNSIHPFSIPIYYFCNLNFFLKVLTFLNPMREED